MQAWTLLALCSVFLFVVACGKQDSTASPESSSETQIQELKGPGIPPHYDGIETLNSHDVVLEEGNEQLEDKAIEE